MFSSFLWALLKLMGFRSFHGIGSWMTSSAFALANDSRSPFSFSQNSNPSFHVALEFNDINYVLWSTLFLLALMIKIKIVFFDVKIVTSNLKDPLFSAWDRCSRLNRCVDASFNFPAGCCEIDLYRYCLRDTSNIERHVFTS